MILYNGGTGGAFHLFRITSDNAFVINTSTGSDILMYDFKGNEMLIAHSAGTGGRIAGKGLDFPVMQISNQSTGAMIFLNQVRTDLLITCNSRPTPTRTFAQGCDDDPKCLLQTYEGTTMEDSLEDDLLQADSIQWFAGQMHEGSSYATDINELDAKIFIVLLPSLTVKEKELIQKEVLPPDYEERRIQRQAVKATGRTDILIAPAGVPVHD